MRKDEDINVSEKTYRLLGSDGKRYASATPGTFGGNWSSKIYGRLDCKATLSAIQRGAYNTKHRVFFADEESAREAGFRPCAQCLPEQYAEWKTGKGINSADSLIPTGSWASRVRVETTVRETHDREAGARKHPITFKADREIDSDETWMFVDGSGTGGHGLVVLRPGQDPHLVARQVRMAMKNVGAEVNAFLTAFETIVPGDRVVIVADFLWGIFYVLGWFNVKHPALRKQVVAAHTLLDARAPASLRFIHIRGHKNDGTALGRWNHVADRLCTLKHPIDCVMPMSAFNHDAPISWLGTIRADMSPDSPTSP